LFARRLDGVSSWRIDDRIANAVSVKPPPRNTRLEPLGETHALPSVGAPE
jgi:hypothetical protein